MGPEHVSVHIVEVKEQSLWLTEWRKQGDKSLSIGHRGLGITIMRAVKVADYWYSYVNTVSMVSMVSMVCTVCMGNNGMSRMLRMYER